MADDPALKDLADNLRAVRQQLGEVADAAKRTKGVLAEQTQTLGAVAGAAGAAGRAVGETLGGALKGLAEGALREAQAGLESFVRNLPEAAARSEGHARALQQLGGAYGAVQQATNGAVSAEQAASLQQKVLQSGLRLSAQELAAVTARAREYARATGTDLRQALDQLGDQLVNPGEELAKFGVRLQSGARAGDALRETLRQLQEQARRTGTSQLSLAESMEATTRAQREASDALAAVVAQRLELRNFFTQLSTWLNDTRTATDGWKTATEAVVGTLREAVGLRAQIGTAQNQSASGQFVSEAGAIAGRLRGRGMSLAGFQFGAFGVRASEAQRQGALAALRQAEAGGMTREQLLGQLSTLDARAVERAARAGADAADDAAEAERARREELARRNRGAGGGAAAARPGQAPDGFGIGSEGFLSEYARNVYEMARARFQASRAPATPAYAIPSAGRDIQRRTDQLSARRESAEARQGLDAADDPTTGPFGARFSRAAGQAETRQREERVRLLRDQSAALRELITAAEREQDIAMREGRPMAEVNDLVRQRIGLQTALAANTRELTQIQEQNAVSFEEVGARLTDTLAGVADGIGEGVAAAIEGSKGFVASMHEMVYGTLRALTKLAVVEALKETAMGIAAAATYRYDAAVQHFASAGVWAAVGIASGAGLAAMPNPNAAKPSAPSGGSERSASADRQAQPDRAAGGPLVINLNVSGAAFTDAGVQAAAAAAFRGAAANGFLTSTDLGGLRG